MVEDREEIVFEEGWLLLSKVILLGKLYVGNISISYFVFFMLYMKIFGIYIKIFEKVNFKKVVLILVYSLKNFNLWLFCCFYVCVVGKIILW